MEKKVEVLHTGFLHQTMGKRVWQNMGGTWVTLTSGEDWEAAGMQLAATYIGCR